MKPLQLVAQGIVVAVIIFVAVLFSGLSTTSLLTPERTYRTFTTLGVGGTQFVILMVSIAFLAVVAAGYLLGSLDAKKA